MKYLSILLLLVAGCIPWPEWSEQVHVMRAYKINNPVEYRNIVLDIENNCRNEATWCGGGPFQIDFFHQISMIPFWCISLDGADWPSDPDLQFCATVCADRIYKQISRGNELWLPVQ